MKVRKMYIFKKKLKSKSITVEEIPPNFKYNDVIFDEISNSYSLSIEMKSWLYSSNLDLFEVSFPTEEYLFLNDKILGVCINNNNLNINRFKIFSDKRLKMFKFKKPKKKHKKRINTIMNDFFLLNFNMSEQEFEKYLYTLKENEINNFGDFKDKFVRLHTRNFIDFYLTNDFYK
jgi:hypothetical protein